MDALSFAIYSFPVSKSKNATPPMELLSRSLPAIVCCRDFQCILQHLNNDVYGLRVMEKQY